MIGYRISFECIDMEDDFQTLEDQEVNLFGCVVTKLNIESNQISAREGER